MKKIFIILFLFNITILKAQTGKDKCSDWEVKASKSEAKVGDEVIISFFVTPKPDWYVYANGFEEGGPKITEINFKKNSSYQLIGKLESPGAETVQDPIFEMAIRKFKKRGEFKQKIKILSENFKVEGTVDYQTCSDKNGQCIPCEYDFSFSQIAVKADAKTDKKELEDTKALNKKDSSDTKNTTQITPVDTFSQKTTKNGTETVKNKPVNFEEAQKEEENLFLFALGAFLAGLLALLTPCVYPMIPMTVTLFMKGDKPISPQASAEEQIQQQAANRRRGIVKALIYGGSIIGIYGLLGLLASLAFGIEFNNDFSTHWASNLLFFSIFIVFGLSFLGMFDIVLPSSFVNKIDRKADGGGYGAVFFMAFTLVLVSFSCTAPIAGSIIMLATQGEVIKPLIGMVAYASAFAIPFTFFALFPTAMKSLPKSGGWLNTVKVFLGFLELALAFKFLSTADLAYHWGILNRDVFLSLWIAVFGAMAMYLFGKIQLPHDTKLDKISVPRAVMAIITTAFTVYMIPGLWGADLKLLSGIIPPKTTQEFIVGQGNNQNVNTDNGDFPSTVKYGDFLKLPHGLKGFYDYQEGVAYAKKVKKPIFLDFTGHGCANCRKMEEYIWVKPEILNILKNDYVIISLYTDDKTELPEKDWVTSKVDGKVKKSMGKINLHFEAERFNNIAQPYYALLDSEGNLLVSPPVGYEPDVKIFEKYLKAGLEAFKKVKV
ncbi:MAG: thioredoxin family protein [Raineya sp.]|jgi:thiol:disulfide interchange protein DsbD|nr:thioredoxin family protein [Raineya sp.]